MSLLSDLDDTATEKRNETSKRKKLEKENERKIGEYYEQFKKHRSKSKVVVPVPVIWETYNALANNARYRRMDRLAKYWESLIWGD